MRHARRLSLGSLGVAALTLCMALSGCGATSTTASGQGAGTGQFAVSSAATAAAENSTATAVASNPTAVPPPSNAADAVQAGCQPAPTPAQPQSVTVGGLRVSIPQRLDDYPSELMPNNEPNAPYQVPLTVGETQQVGAFHPNPPVNPQLSFGYVFQICNETSVAHSLTNMGVSIASFTPRSGPVTVWHICQDGPYDAAAKTTTPGCGSGFAGALLTATLPNDNAGAASSVTGTTWPVTIPPNESIALAVAVNGLTAQGTYTLSFAMRVDGAAPATLTPSDGAFLMAPSAVVWTGTACLASAMLAKIPASTQDSYYVCPPAA